MVNVFSAFNGFDPEKEKAIFLGVADADVAQSGPNSNLHDMISICIHGTRTLPVGQDVVQLGDAVMWEFPYMIRSSTDQQPRPGILRTGVNSAKCIAHVKPMPFEYYGSKNHYRNVVSNFLGNFDPPADENEHFARHVKLQEVLENLMIETARNLTEADMARVIESLHSISGQKQDELRDTYKNYLKALRTGTAGDVFTGPGAAAAPGRAGTGRYAGEPEEKTKMRALLRTIVTHQVKAQTEHHMFFENRYVGMALGSGSNGGVEVFVRAGCRM
jgi:hypothetical protein